MDCDIGTTLETSPNEISRMENPVLSEMLKENGGLEFYNLLDLCHMPILSPFHRRFDQTDVLDEALWASPIKKNQVADFGQAGNRPIPAGFSPGIEVFEKLRPDRLNPDIKALPDYTAKLNPLNPGRTIQPIVNPANNDVAFFRWMSVLTKI